MPGQQQEVVAALRLRGSRVRVGRHATSAATARPSASTAASARRTQREHAGEQQRERAGEHQQRRRRGGVRQLVEAGEALGNVAGHRGFGRRDARGRGRRHVDRDEARVLAHEVMRRARRRSLRARISSLRRAVALRIHQRLDLVARPQHADARLAPAPTSSSSVASTARRRARARRARRRPSTRRVRTAAVSDDRLARVQVRQLRAATRRRAGRPVDVDVGQRRALELAEERGHLLLAPRARRR